MDSVEVRAPTGEPATAATDSGSTAAEQPFLGPAEVRALRESEARYRTLLDAIDEGFCVIEVLFDGDRPVDYRFLEANPAFIAQTGLRDAIGRTVRELVPTHEAHWFEIYGRVAVTGEPTRFEAPAEALGRWYDVYAFRIGQPGAYRVAILFTDITARKRAEAALAASAARQAFLVRLGDTLRPLADAGAIQNAAARILGEHLGATRVMYAEVEGEPGTEAGTIRGRYLAGDGPGAPEPAVPFPDRYAYSTFGERVMALRRRGETMVVADVTTEPPGWRAACAPRAPWRSSRAAGSWPTSACRARPRAPGPPTRPRSSRKRPRGRGLPSSARAPRQRCASARNACDR